MQNEIMRQNLYLTISELLIKDLKKYSKTLTKNVKQKKTVRTTLK